MKTLLASLLLSLGLLTGCVTTNPADEDVNTKAPVDVSTPPPMVKVPETAPTPTPVTPTMSNRVKPTATTPGALKQ